MRTMRNIGPLFSQFFLFHDRFSCEGRGKAAALPEDLCGNAGVFTAPEAVKAIAFSAERNGIVPCNNGFISDKEYSAREPPPVANRPADRGEEPQPPLGAAHPPTGLIGKDGRGGPNPFDQFVVDALHPTADSHEGVRQPPGRDPQPAQLFEHAADRPHCQTMDFVQTGPQGQGTRTYPASRAC